jgi:type I restriction enzyme S subunit
LLAAQHLDYANSIGKMWDYQLQSTGISNFQTKRFLGEEQIIWPGDAMAGEFANAIDPIVKHATRNESRTLTAQRDALLPKLVLGEIKMDRIYG